MIIPPRKAGSREIEVGGQNFPNVHVFMDQLKIWSATLPPAIYQEYLDEGADHLTSFVETQEAHHEEILAEYYNLALSTHPDFETYRKSTKYKQIWGRINDAAENRAKNEQKRKKAQEEVKRLWGARGESFLEINDAFGWCQKASRLARSVNNYDEAMRYLSRALYSRRANVQTRRPCSLQPGGTDLVNAVQLYQAGGGDPTLTDEELNAFIPHFHLSLGNNGLLRYGKADPRITSIEEIQEVEMVSI